MSPTLGLVLVLALFPLSLAAVFLISDQLPFRLVCWFSAGFLMSQWMHVMMFVYTDRLSGSTGTTKLNLLYFFHVPWWAVLIAGVAIFIAMSAGLYSLVRDADDIRWRWALAILAIGLGASQLAGSSVPKLAGELAMAAFLLAGLLVHRYFLTYAPGSTPPAHQMQSDALTSFGLIVILMSVWWPCALGFGRFLFDSYFAEQPQMRQFQMTRYAGMIAWQLVAIGMLGWRSLELLIKARGGAT